MNRSMLTLTLTLSIIILTACGGDETWDPTTDTQAINDNPQLVESQIPQPWAREQLDHMPQEAAASLGRFQVPSTSCAESVCCEIWGRCTTEERTGKCIVGSDEDCRGSMMCANVGYCTRIKTEVGSRCLAGSDDDCQESHACKDFGVCQLGPDHTCQ